MLHVDKSCKYYIKAIICCTAYGCIAMEQYWMYVVLFIVA